MCKRRKDSSRIKSLRLEAATMIEFPSSLMPHVAPIQSVPWLAECDGAGSEGKAASWSALASHFSTHPLDMIATMKFALAEAARDTISASKGANSGTGSGSALRPASGVNVCTVLDPKSNNRSP